MANRVFDDYELSIVILCKIKSVLNKDFRSFQFDLSKHEFSLRARAGISFKFIKFNHHLH